MAKRKGSDGDYTVGKGRPPKEFCWPQGTSGNPHGRPRNKTLAKMIDQFDPFAAMVIASDAKRIERRDANGRTERLLRSEAALERLLRKAMEGNVRANLEYLKITKAAMVIQRDHHMEMLYMAISHRDKHMRTFLLAEHLGKPVPNIFPHPEDILIREDGSVEIVGPATESQHLEMLKIVELRDVAFRALDEFAVVAGPSAQERTQHMRDISGKLDYLNSLLPPRLRRDWTS